MARRAVASLATLAVSFLLFGCGASESSRSRATVTVTVAQGAETSSAGTDVRRPPSVAQAVSLKTFGGSYFSVDYSGSWYVEAAEADKGSYLDTTIRNRANPQVMLRVDVAPGAATGDPVSSARQVELALRGQPGYRRLDFSRTTFHGYPALRWEFEVNEGGTALRKVDIFFETETGDSFAVLTQAPASTHTLWRRLFAQARASLHVRDSNAGSTYNVAPSSDSGGTANGPPTTESAFCDSHACIANFDNGIGAIVQCADGMWSHSGGRPGACSYHGGVADGSSGGGSYEPDYGTGSDYTEDYGNGNGYTVVCADGTTSDSGGIQGACSHHGGVGG